MMRNIGSCLGFLLSCIVFSANAQVQPSYFIEGEVKSLAGKGIGGARVEVLSISKSFFTDKKGKFFINIPAENYLIRVSAEHFKSKEYLISLKKDTVLNIVLETLAGGILLEEVQIKGRSTDKVRSLVAGMERLDRATVEKMPSLLGEKDPIKALQFLPGVTGTTEGSAEMNVRGGGNDQNMVLLDNIPLYSSTHLFGLYSSFNPLAISSTTLYKGDFPASFGGRLSSVTSLISIDTVSKRFEGSLELSPATAKAALSVPIIDQKSSLFIAGRRSYYDILFKTFGKGQADIFSFQDYNLNWIYHPDQKNRFKLTAYYEDDAVGTVAYEGGFAEGSTKKSQTALGLDWKHRFNNNISNEATLYHNSFNSSLKEEKRKLSPSYLYNFKTAIADLGFKNTVNYTLNNVVAQAGVDAVRHRFMPTRLSGDEEGEPFFIKNLPDRDATDLSFFVDGKFKIGEGSNLSLGLRNNNYFVGNVSYYSFEPRFSFMQRLSENSSIKLSYARMTQPVQRLTNPGLGLPQDIILSADQNIRPQSADHFSMEFARDFKFDGEKFSFSVQPFYKKLNHIISFKDGYNTRSLMFGATSRASNYNDVITSGKGNTYGIELMLEKKTGKLNGWASYTLMKASNQFPLLNNGLSFSSTQDRRHNFNVVGNWQINKKWNVGFSWMFISGQPMTVPESFYLNTAPIYSTGELTANRDSKFGLEQGSRGNYRMKPFHKLDITAEYNFKLLGLDATLNFGAYNVYNRRNPSFYYIGKTSLPPDGKSIQNQPVLKSVSLFPIIPTASLKVRL